MLASGPIQATSWLNKDPAERPLVKMTSHEHSPAVFVLDVYSTLLLDVPTNACPALNGLPGSGFDDRQLASHQVESGALNKLFFSIAATASEFAYRLWLPYKQFPWCLAQLSDPRCSTQQKELIERKLYHTNVCCLDESFSVRLRSIPRESVAEVCEVMTFQKIQNMEIEDNFSRAARMRASTAGNLNHISIFCLQTLVLPDSVECYKIVWC